MFFSNLLEYTANHFDVLVSCFIRHLALVTTSLFFSVVVAIPLGWFLSRKKELSIVVLSIFSIIYSIPSLSLLSIFIPITGLGFKTAVIVLLLYSQFILLRNIIAGFSSIGKNVIEAGKGMGMSKTQLFFWIQLPLAAPAILSGIRIATVSAIGIADIAASVGAGGIGTLLFQGMQTMDYVKMFWGTVLSAGLAFCANQILSDLEHVALLKASGWSAET